MFAENELSVSTNNNVRWDLMVYQLCGLTPKDTKIVVEILLPAGAFVTNNSTFHYANSSNITCEFV